MGVDGDGAAVDTPIARHHTVGIDRVVIAWRAGKRAGFDERPFVEKRIDALTRRGLPGIVAALACTLGTRILRAFEAVA